MTKKDTINAILNYKKALQVKNNAETQIMLDALITKGTSIPVTVDLQNYAGVYVLETYNISIILEIRDAKLWSIVPGQDDGEFQLLSENVFTVKGKQGYTITFQMDGDKPKGFTSVQPNGTFHAIFKNK